MIIQNISYNEITYCMSVKSAPILYSNSLLKLAKTFWTYGIFSGSGIPSGFSSFFHLQPSHKVRYAGVHSVVSLAYFLFFPRRK